MYKKLICMIMRHTPRTHLDYIYGSLPREHKECTRCGATLLFRKPTPELEQALLNIGDVRDGAVGGCKPIND